MISTAVSKWKSALFCAFPVDSHILNSPYYYDYGMNMKERTAL